MNNFNQQSYFAPASNVRATNNIIWVQGIEGAKAWQLAPNSMAIFLDLAGSLYAFGQKLLIIIF